MNNCTNEKLALTIEQWEIIDRIKKSGMSKMDFCLAYDELDKISSSQASLSLPKYNKCNFVNGPFSPMNQQSQYDHPIFHVPYSEHFCQSMRTPNFPSSDSSSQHVSICSDRVEAPFHKGANEEVCQSDIDKLFDAGESNVLLQIKSYMDKNFLSVEMVGQYAGLDPGIVRAIFESSNAVDRKHLVTLFAWYIGCLKAGQIKNFQIGEVNQCSKHKSPVSLALRRPRFLFKPEHLAVLEQEFSVYPYPDTIRREEIVAKCNKARLLALGRTKLSERELLNETVVKHWFQNKRKLVRLSTKGYNFDASDKLCTKDTKSCIPHLDTPQKDSNTSEERVKNHCEGPNIDKTSDDPKETSPANADINPLESTENPN